MPDTLAVMPGVGLSGMVREQRVSARPVRRARARSSPVPGTSRQRPGNRRPLIPPVDCARLASEGDHEKPQVGGNFARAALLPLGATGSALSLLGCRAQGAQSRRAAWASVCLDRHLRSSASVVEW
jgi:hypothetical protein